MQANRKDSDTKLKWLKVNTCIQVGKKFYAIFTPGVFVFDSVGDIYYLTDEKNREVASWGAARSSNIIVANLRNTNVILTVVTICHPST